jgi:predicted Co/Zn/Cd cation transporter (cation efflux family)
MNTQLEAIEIVGAPAGTPDSTPLATLPFEYAIILAFVLSVVCIALFLFRARLLRSTDATTLAWRLIQRKRLTSPASAHQIEAFAAEKGISPAAAWVLVAAHDVPGERTDFSA